MCRPPFLRVRPDVGWGPVPGACAGARGGPGGSDQKGDRTMQWYRKDVEDLSADDCWELLRADGVGRLAVVVDG